MIVKSEHLFIYWNSLSAFVVGTSASKMQDGRADPFT